MNEQDSVKLLRECDAGIKMGVSSIDEVTSYAQSEKMKQKLCEFKTEHETLKGETETELFRAGAELKEPNAMAKSMSWVKTNMKLAMEGSDRTIANLMTDGCNMGIKSLYRYLNQYSGASEKSKDIAKRLIDLEQRMTDEMRGYL